MDALWLLGWAGMVVGYGGLTVAWWDPGTAEKLAAKLRGRATELRMLAQARTVAREAARNLAEASLAEWEKARQGNGNAPECLE